MPFFPIALLIKMNERPIEKHKEKKISVIVTEHLMFNFMKYRISLKQGSQTQIH